MTISKPIDDTLKGDRQSSSQSNSDHAYDWIKQRILSNKLVPGTAIRIQDLASELGMSRTPIKAALIQLEKEDLVELTPRQGMRVKPIHPQTMKEIYEILAGLEVIAVELIAARSPSEEEMAELVEAQTDMENALADDDRDAWAGADERFHQELVSLAGNKRLAAIVSTFRDQTRRARILTLGLRPKPDNSTQSHRMLLEALRSGDAEEALALHCKQRLRSASELTELLARYNLYAL